MGDKETLVVKFRLYFIVLSDIPFNVQYHIKKKKKKDLKVNVFNILDHIPEN